MNTITRCAAVGMLASVSAAAASMEWVYEGIEPEKVAGSGDAALDAQDYAHVVYGRSALYYDWEEADGWHCELVDGQVAPDTMALVLDGAGLPHVVYLDLLTAQVKYARKGAAEWSVEAIADDPGGGNFGTTRCRIAICLDAADRPHITYTAATGAPGNTAVVHLNQEGTVWHRTSVGSWDDVKNIGALVVTVADDGRPHVGWELERSGSGLSYFWHAWQSAGSWHAVSTTGAPVAAMQFDAEGRLHVAYEDDDDYRWDGIGYALGTETGFNSEPLIEGKTRTWRLGGALIRLSRDGVPHIVFDLINDETGLQHWAKIDGSWHHSLIDPATEPPDTSEGYNLALDAAGRPHVIYRLLTDWSNGWLNRAIKTAWQDAEGWHTRSEPSAPTLTGGDLLMNSGNEMRFFQAAIGFSSQTATEWRHRRLGEDRLGGVVDLALAVDGHGSPHIAYASHLLGSKYAWHDASGWHTTWLPDTSAPDPTEIRLAIDGEGRPHVAYQRSSGVFSHAVLGESGWEVAELNTPAAWMIPAMALDGMDRPHFLAHEQWPDYSWHLAYYRPGADGWQRESVPATGGDPGIAVDQSGNPHIVYLADGEIWYGVRTVRGWLLSKVVSPPDSLWVISLCGPVIDERNQLHICWAENTVSGEYRVYYARKDPGGWHTTEVDTSSSGYGYRVSSLALGVDGAPQITYVDFGEGVGGITIVLSRLGAEGWERVPVERSGEDNAMAVDAQGRPHIVSYGARGQLGYLWPSTVFQRTEWGAIASPQEAGTPIPATLTARTAAGGVYTTFADTVTLSATVPGVAATDFSLGAGSHTWDYPLYTEYHDARTTVIYAPEVLGQDCTITSLSLEVTTPPGQTLQNWTIRMKPTDRTTYVSLSPAAWETTGWTVVYQGDEPAGAAGWRTFEFGTPYEFSFADGENLLVDFSFNNASYTTAGACRASVKGTGVSISGFSDSRNGDPLTWSGANPEFAVSSHAPNIMLGTIVPIRVPTSVSPTSVGPFVDGVWTGIVTIGDGAAGVILLADDGAGHGGESNPFNVIGVSQPPVIVGSDGLFGLIGGTFGFNVQGQDGRIVVIQGSADLRDWLPLQTNSLGSGPVYFSDPASSTQPYRYYRLLQP